MLSTDQTLHKGRYRIINLFSHDDSGGMYEAYDTVNNANVVLKECVNQLDNLASTEEILAADAAFAASAKVLTTIKHDSLVSVQDYFAEIGSQFLVLEGVTGQDLTKFLDPDVPRPTLSDVMSWTNKVLAGLHYLHRLSPPIIHRDIRPKNIKLTTGAAVKLLTAGIGLGPTVGNTRQVSVRATGNSARHYRPLEQLYADADQATQSSILDGFDESGKRFITTPLDAASDLYSVGASIYHILTGTLPPDAVTRVSAIQEGKPDPLKSPAEIDENIPVEISDAFMKSMAIRRDERFDSAVIMNQVLRTALVRNQERTADGAEIPVQLKKLSRTKPVEKAPVPEAPVFQTPALVEPVIEATIAEKHEVLKAEIVSHEPVLEIEHVEADELEVERERLEEEQKRIEQRRLELEAEQQRRIAERQRLEQEAEKERKQQEQERLAKEAEEEKQRQLQEQERLAKQAEAEKQRAAQKIAELEAEKQKRQAEEKRLEQQAEEERKRAAEKLKALQTEHDRIRAERRKIEEAEKEELERTEKRLLELSVQPNNERGELPERDGNEHQLLEVDTSDPGVKSTQEIIELLTEEHQSVDPSAVSSRNQDYGTPVEFSFDMASEKRSSGLKVPMIAGASVLFLIIAVSAWMFMSPAGKGSESSEPAVAVTEQPSAPVDQTIVEQPQNNETTLATSSNVADTSSSVTLPADVGDANARSAFTAEQERKAKLAKEKKAAQAANANKPKKVTVDDLINDN